MATNRWKKKQKANRWAARKKQSAAKKKSVIDYDALKVGDRIRITWKQDPAFGNRPLHFTGNFVEVNKHCVIARDEATNTTGPIPLMMITSINHV